MKNLLAIAAMFVAVIFTGCSKDDDNTTYNGDFIGSWECSYSWNNSDGSSGKEQEIITFGSNGVLTIEYKYTEYDSAGNIIDEGSEKDSTTYTYNNGVLTYEYVDEVGYYGTMLIEVSGDYLILTEEDGSDAITYTRVK